VGELTPTTNHVREEQSLGLPSAAKVYLGVIGIAGVSLAVLAFHSWPPEFSGRFLVYLCLALAAGRMKVPYPGSGSLSVSNVIVMLGMVELGTSETLLLALAGAVISTLALRRYTSAHVTFNSSASVVAAFVASWVFHEPWFRGISEFELLRLMLAGVAFFIVNMTLLTMMIALAEKLSFNVVRQTCSKWLFFYYLVAAALAELVHSATRVLGFSFTLASLPLLYAIYRSYRIYFEKLAQEKSHAQNMAALHLRTIEALAMAIEAKDECTHEHLRRVQVYSLEMAKHLGLPEEELNALQAASILHDIGKLAVPDHIISKPGKLTPEEFEKMKIHTIVGAEILEQVAFPYAVAPIVRSHHEKWDGSGYPDGLVGEQIPMGARILSAVDCLDALASDRQYRRALPLDDAMAYVAGLAGQSFDPKVIDILKEHYREFERLAQNTPFAITRLRKDIVVNRGGAPDAGYEKNQTQAEREDSSKAQAVSVASSRRGMQAILELAQDANASLRPEELLSLAAERLKHVVPYDCIAVYVRQGDVLKPCYVNGENSRTFASLEIPLGQGLSGWVADNGKPIVNGNPSVEPGYLNDPTRFSLLNSALSIPLRGGSEQILGALTLYRADKDAYNQEQLRVLLAISDKIARVVELALKQKPEQEVNQDELTGLPNADMLYTHFQKELSRCGMQGKTLALLACELDGLRQINDRYGHISGDGLLKRVAFILQSNCRSSDYVARVGGHEFMLVFSGADSSELAGRVASLGWKVREAGREMFGDENIGIYVGLACFPENGADAETLLSYAEQQMERAKQTRKPSDGSVLQLARSLESPALLPVGHSALKSQ
jgi:diguanylate cyclase (GGDEF)-like protein/putative nucleotidyltransferase with HDIG domain